MCGLSEKELQFQNLCEGPPLRSVSPEPAICSQASLGDLVLWKIQEASGRPANIIKPISSLITFSQDLCGPNIKAGQPGRAIHPFISHSTNTEGLLGTWRLWTDPRGSQGRP